MIIWERKKNIFAQKEMQHKKSDNICGKRRIKKRIMFERKITSNKERE
jgi:hypothetical protein